MTTRLLSTLRQWFEGLTARQKIFVALLAFSLIATLILLVGDSSVSSDPLDTTPFYFFSAFIKLIVVVLLIFGAAAIFRRWIQPGAGIQSNRQMRLVETIRLSPRQALHLVSVGGQTLLIGATDQNVSLISPIEEDANGMEFGSLLQSIKTGENENLHV
jgi:flagellar biosynthetic protein FliO